MPSRSFFQVPDQAANAAIMRHIHGGKRDAEILSFVSKGIAPLLDHGSVAQLLGISPKILFDICARKHRHYREFKLHQPNQKFRQIHAPRTYLKVIQWWILDNILSKFEFDDYVTGFVRGRGPIHNALRHFGARHLLNMDLENFFPSIDSSRVQNIWRDLGYVDAIVEQLTELVTFDDFVPQGAPTSPAIANISANELDHCLETLAVANSLVYSRYADDITFSSGEFIGVHIYEQALKIVLDCGFRVNKQKTRFLGPGQRLEVTGVVLNKKIQYPRSWRNRARAIFHNASNDPRTYIEKVDMLVGYLGALKSVPGSEQTQLLSRGEAALQAVRNAAARELQI